MEKLVLLSKTCEDLAGSLNASLIEMKEFPDSECYVRIPVEVGGREVVLFHRCYPHPNKSLVQLFLMLNQLREMGARRVAAVVPYLPYARQDKRFKPGEALSAKVICRMIRDAGCDELVTFDCHFLKDSGVVTYEGLPIRNLTMSKRLLAHLNSSALVISPDKSRAYMTGRNGNFIQKERGEYKEEGETTFREIKEMKAEFEVGGRDVILIDDIIAVGSTMITAVGMMKEKGARKISCAATHGLFLNGSLGKLRDAGASEVLAANSVLSEVSKVDILAELLEAKVV